MHASRPRYQADSRAEAFLRLCAFCDLVGCILIKGFFVLNFLIVPFLFLLRFAMFFPERGKRSVPYMRLPAYFPVAFVERFPVSLFCFWCFSCFVFLFLVLFLFLFFCFRCFWCCSFVKPE